MAIYRIRAGSEVTAQARRGRGGGALGLTPDGATRGLPREQPFLGPFVPPVLGRCLCISCNVFWSFCARLSASPSLFLSQPLSLCVSMNLPISLSLSLSLSPCLFSLYLAVSASQFLFRASWFFTVSLYRLCFCLMDGGRGGERGLIPSRGPSPRGLPHHWLPGVQTPHSAPVWRFPGRSPSVPQFAI